MRASHFKIHERYIYTIVFTLTIIGLYQSINIKLFSLDLTKRTREALFVIRNVPDIDRTTILFNVGKLQPGELEIKIDSLLILQPRRIGVNLCHFKKVPIDLINKYKADKRVVFANCENLRIGALGQIIGDHNTVTHFKTDRADYFELQLTDFKGRGNDRERINYGPRLNFLNKGELTSSYYWFNPDLKEKTILLGYMGDYLTDSIYYYQDCRITPLNQYYGENNLLPDMYDIEISANILRTINDNDFINEVSQMIRILIMLTFSIFTMTVLTFVETRWTIINLLIATILFILLTAIGSFLLLYMFDKRYFLEMDELPLILLTTTSFVVILNISKKKVSPQQL